MSPGGSTPPLPPDQAPGAPHPRAAESLFGHEAAERAFLESWRAGRLHHAWLLFGPRGIGKATLAYRIARFMLADSEPNASSLHVPPDSPVAKRIRAESEERLFAVRRVRDDAARPAGRIRFFTVIRIDDIRALQQFFQRTPISGGWRIAVVDAADDLSESAANALLKVLEEPPERSLLLLVSHAPRRLSATIRSRCRRLRLDPLAPEPFRQAVLGAQEAAGRSGGANSGARPVRDSEVETLARESEGSPGEAIRMHALGGVALRRELNDLLAGLPALDRRSMVNFAAGLAGADAQEKRQLAASMLERSIGDLARAAAGAPDGTTDLARRIPRLVADEAQARIWAETASGLRGAIDEADAVNVDPSTTFLVALSAVEDAARRARDRTA